MPLPPPPANAADHPQLIPKLPIGIEAHLSPDPARPDLFQWSHSIHINFPCCSCIHFNSPLSVAPCEHCTHYAR